MLIGVGTQLGSFEILSLLGKGGMGEVYRARDTKLKREVAVKILPDEFSSDHDRASRFQREAELLASLNHPNIAAIYDLQEAKDRHFLVLELVEGETLAERIARGPLPVDEALHIAKQICEALEAAQDKGIIHRDLKPANVKVMADGTAKVLDFGLAKAMERSPANQILSNSPTLSVAATNAGVILGTAAYMSPEQAKGFAVDHRSDIFSFGSVLYEMLIGRRPFDGDSVPEILAAVLAREPDLSLLPANLSEKIRTIVERCLRKNPKRRWQAIGDVRLEIEEALAKPFAAPEVQSAARPARTKLWTVTAVLALVAILSMALLMYWRRPLVTNPQAVRFLLSPPDNSSFGAPIALGLAAAAGSISPDGRKLAFTAANSSGKVTLWVRSLDELVPQPLSGSEDASFLFWSPDSRWLGFFAQSKLKKVDIAGAQPQILCDALSPRGGTWNREGTILFATTGGSGLSRVSSAGGDPVKLTRFGAGLAAPRFPYFLPDGRHFLYLESKTSTNESAVFIGALDSNETQRLIDADSAAIYAPPGYLLFVRQGVLLAQAFDAAKRQLTGDPVRIADSVNFDLNGATAFSTSDNGVLSYRTGIDASDLQFAWFDRSGKLLETLGVPGAYRGVDLSPDEKRVAVHRHDGNGGDIWIIEPRGIMTRLTFDATQDNSMPIWSPDGNRIAFGSLRNGKWGIYVKPSNGTGAEELLVESEVLKVPMGWSPDGQSIVFEVNDPTTFGDSWLVSLSGDHKSTPLLNSSFYESHPQISPNGKWIAYYANYSGHYEIYVKPFPTGEGRWQVSAGVGYYPRWRQDGKEIFYLTQVAGGKVMAVSVNDAGPAFEAETPHELFDSASLNVHHVTNYHPYAVSSDGQRILISRPASNLSGASSNTAITIVLNWTSLLQK